MMKSTQWWTAIATCAILLAGTVGLKRTIPIVADTVTSVVRIRILAQIMQICVLTDVGFATDASIM